MFKRYLLALVMGVGIIVAGLPALADQGGVATEVPKVMPEPTAPGASALCTTAQAAEAQMAASKSHLFMVMSEPSSDFKSLVAISYFWTKLLGPKTTAWVIWRVDQKTGEACVTGQGVGVALVSPSATQGAPGGGGGEPIKPQPNNQVSEPSPTGDGVERM